MLQSVVFRESRLVFLNIMSRCVVIENINLKSMTDWLFIWLIYKFDTNIKLYINYFRVKIVYEKSTLGQSLYLSCCFSNTGLKSTVLNLMILDKSGKTSGQPKSYTPSTNYKPNLIMYKIKWLEVKSTLTVSLNCVLTSCVFTSENSGKVGRCRNSKLNDPSIVLFHAG